MTFDIHRSYSSENVTTLGSSSARTFKLHSGEVLLRYFHYSGDVAALRLLEDAAGGLTIYVDLKTRTLGVFDQIEAEADWEKRSLLPAHAEQTIAL